MENVPQADLDNYYTKSEVDNAIAAETMIIRGSMAYEDINGETITFDMPAAEMFALGKELLKYDVRLLDNENYIYTLSHVEGVPDSFVKMVFVGTETDRINHLDIYIRKNGTFDTQSGGVEGSVIYRIPNPQNIGNTHYLVAENGQYKLVEKGETEDLELPLIMAIESEGQLIPTQPKTLESILEELGDNALFTLRLITIDEAETAFVLYSVLAANMAEQTLIFTNGADKQVILNTDGSLSYCDITNYATVNQVNTLISEALGVIENGSY